MRIFKHAARKRRQLLPCLLHVPGKLLLCSVHRTPPTPALLTQAVRAEIKAGDRPRLQVQRDIKVKERAREALCRRCASCCCQLVIAS